MCDSNRYLKYKSEYMNICMEGCVDSV